MPFLKGLNFELKPSNNGLVDESYPDELNDFLVNERASGRETVFKNDVQAKFR